MWPPMTTISSGFSRPSSSPITLRDGASGSVCASILSVTTIFSPRSCMRWNIMASSIGIAAEGIFVTVES